MYVVADIGGTKMRIAGSRDLQSFGEPVIASAPQTYEQAVQEFSQSAKTIAAGEKIDGVAIGIPGVLSRDKRTVFNAQNAPLWNGHGIAGDIEKMLGARAYLQNDTALVGLGEANFGAGKGANIVMYMTVSTGVNAARIVNGAIDAADFGFETGDQYLIVGDAPVALGDLISGRALEKRFGKAPRDLGKDSPVWEELARFAVFGVYNSILHWSPQRVVLGGSMFNEIGISIDRIAAHLREINKEKLPELPPLVHSALGDLGGLWGGLALLSQKKD